MPVDQKVQVAFTAAWAARARAHAPYSKFQVGAAVQIRGQSEPITGCNVENASFGATVCAERVALWQARARFGAFTPEFLVVVTAEPKATVPCAQCLQVMAEFCSDDMPVYLGNQQGILRELRFKDLLPEPFRAFAVDSK